MHHCHAKATSTGIITQLLHDAESSSQSDFLTHVLSLNAHYSVFKTFDLSVRLKIPQNTSVSSGWCR